MSYRELNRDLKKRLKKEFSPLGIVAYSGCCRWGCTGSYGGDGQCNFEDRKNGIYYIKLFLDGMNYDDDPRSCYVPYCVDGDGDAYEYLMNHWEEECRHLRKFCEILGLLKDEYTIIKPSNIKECICIRFHRSLHLEPMNE